MGEPLKVSSPDSWSTYSLVSVLVNIVAASHMWLLKLKLIEINNSVPLSHGCRITSPNSGLCSRCALRPKGGHTSVWR